MAWGREMPRASARSSVKISSPRRRPFWPESRATWCRMAAAAVHIVRERDMMVWQQMPMRLFEVEWKYWRSRERDILFRLQLIDRPHSPHFLYGRWRYGRGPAMASRRAPSPAGFPMEAAGLGARWRPWQLTGPDAAG